MTTFVVRHRATGKELNLTSHEIGSLLEALVVIRGASLGPYIKPLAQEIGRLVVDRVVESLHAFEHGHDACNFIIEHRAALNGAWQQWAVSKLCECGVHTETLEHSELRSLLETHCMRPATESTGTLPRSSCETAPPGARFAFPGWIEPTRLGRRPARSLATQPMATAT